MFEKFRDLPVTLPDFEHVPVFHRCYFDFAGPIPNDPDFGYFIVAADYTSNSVVARPCSCPNKEAVAHLIFGDIPNLWEASYYCH